MLTGIHRQDTVFFMQPRLRTNIDDVDVLIGDKLVITAVGLWDVQIPCELSSSLLVPRGDRGNSCPFTSDDTQNPLS